MAKRSHRESCPFLFRRNGGELPPVLCERTPFFLGEMEEHPRRPFREQNPLRSRESKKSSFVWQDFFARNMEGGFLTGSESFCGKSQGESPFFLGKKLRSILPIYSLKESRRIVPRNQGKLCPTFMRKEPLLERK